MPRSSSKSKKSQDLNDTFTEGSLTYKKGRRTKKAQVLDYDELKDISAVTPSKPARKSTRKSTRKTEAAKSQKQKRKAAPKEEEEEEEDMSKASSQQEEEPEQGGGSSYSRRRKKQRLEQANEEEASPSVLSPKPSKHKFRYPPTTYGVDEAILEEDMDCKELVARLTRSICEAEREGLGMGLTLPSSKAYILPFLNDILDELPALVEDEFPDNLEIKDEVNKKTKEDLGSVNDQLSDLESEIEHCKSLLEQTSASLIPSAFQLSSDSLPNDDDDGNDENEHPLHNQTEEYVRRIEGLVQSVKTSAQRIEGCQEDLRALMAEASLRQSDVYEASKKVMDGGSSSSSSSKGGASNLIAKLSKRKKK